MQMKISMTTVNVTPNRIQEQKSSKENGIGLGLLRLTEQELYVRVKKSVCSLSTVRPTNMYTE